MTKLTKLRYADTASAFRTVDVPYTWTPPTPTGPYWVDMGAYWDQITLGWNDMPYADYYNVYCAWTGQAKYLRAQTSATTWTLPMGPDVNHQLWVASVDGRTGAESGHSGPHQVRSGHPQSVIGAGTGYVSNGWNSNNRWREGVWGYGGSSQPYWGWYTTEAYRYHSLWEIAPETMWQVVCNSYPSLTNYRNSVGSTGFGMFISRLTGVGTYSSATTTQISLAENISYASSAEPPQVGNVVNISVQPVASGQVGYSMPGNWPQAIYQYHDGYMGLLARPYFNGGSRVNYAAANNGGVWDLSISWGDIVTQGQQNSTSW